MIENKRFIEISVIAILFVIGIGFLSFYVGEKTEQMITGRAISRVYILETPPANCSVELREGLNFVSFFCEHGATSINKTLVNALNQTLDYKAVFSYVPNSPNNSWSTYNPELPDYVVHDMSNIDRYHGYWVDMNAYGNYSKVGVKFSVTNINLQPGWNMVGYPSNVDINISLGLSSINGNYTVVKSFQNVNGTYKWLTYEPSVNDSITHLQPMKAYFINATDTATWTVNW